MPPRILHVMAGGPVGGIETFFFDAVLALAAAGVPQSVIVRPNAPRQIQRLTTAGIPVATTGFNRWLPWLSGGVIRQAAAAFKPDIIQYWTARAGEAGISHSAVQVAWFAGYKKARQFPTCRWFIALTRDVARHIEKQGIEPAQVTVIHNFTDYAPAPPVDRGAIGTPKDATLLLALARLHPMKGLDVLLDAMAALPDHHLWIAGEGLERGALEAQRDRLGLGERVRFLGWRDDGPALLAAADISVVPSRYESFGAVLIESWASGKPLVAAAAQGPKAFVDNEHNGLLVPMENPSALADAIRRVTDEPELRSRLIQQGLATYEEGFTRKVYVAEALTFYERVLRTEGKL